MNCDVKDIGTVIFKLGNDLYCFPAKEMKKMIDSTPFVKQRGPIENMDPDTLTRLKARQRIVQEKCFKLPETDIFIGGDIIEQLRLQNNTFELGNGTKAFFFLNEQEYNIEGDFYVLTKTSREHNEAKFEEIKEIKDPNIGRCVSPVDFSGDPLVMDGNLVVIKLENQEQLVCMTRQEIDKELNGLPFAVEQIVPIGEVPRDEYWQEDINQNINILETRQNQFEFRFYNIPYINVWVDYTFAVMVSEIGWTNVVLRKQPEKIVLFKSMTVSGLHDYKTDWYKAEGVYRCDLFPNLPCEDPIDKIRMVRENGLHLEKIKKQDRSMKLCMTAIHQNLGAVAYVPEGLLFTHFTPNIKIYLIKRAIQQGDSVAVSLFIECDIINAENGGRVLAWACGDNNRRLIERLLDFIDVNSEDGGALCTAVDNNHRDLVGYLIQQGANVFIRDNYAFCSAMENDNYGMLKLLVEKSLCAHRAEQEEEEEDDAD